jgi:tRNA(fMet)-specific endonuclease VapC
MKGYLLDTNILSDLIKKPQGRVAHKIAMLDNHHVQTSLIVASELRFGAMKKGSQSLITQVDRILSAIKVLPYDVPSDQHYAAIRCHLEQQGTPIGPNDMLIAAQALAHQLIVVTANEREFRRVPNLQVENWLSP